MKQELFIEKLNGHDSSGKVGKIYKKAGEKVAAGEILFSIESGKGSCTFNSKHEGVLNSLGIKEGDTVKKGQSVGSIETTSNIVSEGVDEKKLESKSGAVQYCFGITKAEKKILEVDLAIIGGGPGGYVAAIRGAQSGLKVVIIEEDRLGGTCLNYGCIPTKAMASSVSVLNHIKKADEFGFEIPSVRIDFKKLMDRKNNVVEQLVGGIEYLMTSNGIEYIKGTAVVESKNQLSVKNKKMEIKIAFKNLIIAAGAKPCSLPIEGNDNPDILTSQGLLSLEEIPKSLTIIGGGVIGMEFAFIYRALGSEVSVVEFLPQILCMLDEDVVKVIKESAIEKGIKIYEGACASAIKDTLDGSKLLEIRIGDDHHFICTEKIAMAVGRKANLDSIDLNMLNVELNAKKNGIAVDEFMHTSNRAVYAIGDVTNIMHLAHVASHQAIIAVDHINGGKDKMTYDLVPSAIFTNPEIGHVGMTEKEAKLKELNYLVSKFPFAANGKAVAMLESEGFVKLIADADSRLIIGATIVGVHATDLLAVVVNLISGKVTIEEASHVIYAHPTTSESINEAIWMLDNRGIHFA